MKFCVFLLILASIGISCTSSPLGDDNISGDRRTVRGKVVLDDGSVAQGVFVWLEGFDLFAKTNNTGAFSLTLPPPVAQGGTNGANGTFNLYFYLANYSLTTSELVVRDGEFLYSQGDLNNKGELIEPKRIVQFLDINTTVTPEEIDTDYSGRLDVDVRLRATTVDSVTVVIPTSDDIVDLRPFGTVIFKHTATGQLLNFSVIQGDAVRNRHQVGTGGITINMPVDPSAGVFPLGEYEVIPHILVNHETLPPGLRAYLNPSIDIPGEDYLEYPLFRRWRTLKVVEPGDEEDN